MSKDVKLPLAGAGMDAPRQSMLALRAERIDSMRKSGIGIRGLFRIAILVVVAMAYFAMMYTSYLRVSADEEAKAEASVRSEVAYLCLQLQSLEDRVEAFRRVVGSTGANLQKLESDNPEEYRLLTSSVGEVLKGYTLAETGTVAIISDGVVVASDDARVPVGSDAREILGDELLAAIDASLQDDALQDIPFKGVFDEPGGKGAYGDGDDQAYLLAARQGDYTVMIIEPVSMVFRDRDAVMGRETFASLIILWINSSPQLVLWHLQNLGKELPCPRNSFLLEIIAEGEVTQHLKVGLMTGSTAYIFNITSTNTTLAGGNTRARWLYLACEICFKRRHAGTNH